jgi:hypothetical protein
VAAKGKVKVPEYQRQLAAFQNAVAYTDPSPMLELCRESFAKRIDAPEKPVFNIKNDALRPFYYMIYAARAKFAIKSSSPWATLGELEKRGILDSAERTKAAAALNFFINVRHIIGFGSFQAEDSKHLTRESRQVVAAYLRLSPAEFDKKVEISSLTLRQIAEEVFVRLEGRKIENVAV